MIAVKKLMFQSEFARNVLTLMSGTTVAQAIPFLISPIISRIYSPQDMDVLTLFLGMVGLLAPVITGTYENAIMLPKEDREAFHVTTFATLLALIISLVMIPVVIVFNRQITEFQNNPDISIWLYLVPVSIFLVSFYQILTYWSMRRKQYRQIAVSRMTQTISTSGVNLGMGAARLVSSGLVVGALVGQALAMFSIAWVEWRQNHLQRYGLNRQGLLKVARDYVDFPRYTLPQTFLDGVRDSGLIFLLSILFLPGTLGAYGFTLKILRAPLNLIGVAIGQVFYQRAADVHNSGEDLMPMLKGVLLRLSVVALPILLVLLVAGPQLFALVFGQKWLNAGRYAQLLSPWILLQFITSPVSQIPLILRKQRMFLIISAGYDLIVPSAFGLAAYLTQNVEISLMTLSLTASLYLSGILFWFIWLVKNNANPFVIKGDDL